MDPEPSAADVAIGLSELVGVLVRLHPRDISLTAEATLLYLERSGPCRVAELVAASGTAQPSMTGLVDRLEAAGWVERTRDPGDGRAVLVALTDAGVGLLEQRRAVTTARIVDLLRRLPDGDVASLAAALPAVTRLHDLEADRSATRGRG